MNFMKVIKLLLLVVVISMNAQADESLHKMMEGMLKQHRGLVDNFFKQGSAFDSQLLKKQQDIEIQSSIEKQDSKTFEKVSIIARDGEAKFDVKVTDHVMINASLTKTARGRQSMSSVTKMFPLPHKGVYRPKMTKNSKDKVELFFEVPADHKIYKSAFSNMPSLDLDGESLDSFMNMDISKDIDRIKDQLMRSFGGEEPEVHKRKIIKPKRKALFPQKKS